MFIGETWKNNGNDTNEGAVYAFTLSFGGTWMEHTKLQLIGNKMTSLG